MNNNPLPFDVDTINVDIDLAGLGVDVPKVKIQGITKKEKPKVPVSTKKKEAKSQRVAQSAKINTISESLTSSQDEAINLWLEGKTKTEIASELSLPIEIVNEWFKDVDFNKTLEKTKEEMQIVYQNRIDKLTPLAIQRIEEMIVNPTSEKITLMACDKVLKASGILTTNNTNNTVNKSTQIIINSEYKINNQINDTSEDDFVVMDEIDLDENELAMVNKN